MIKVVEVPLSIDLTEFAEFLWLHQIPHRISEDQQHQILSVPDHIDTEQVRFIFQQWKQGADLTLIKVKRPLHQRVNPGRYPITLTLLLASVLTSLLIGFGSRYDWMHWLTITDFRLSGTQLIYTHLYESIHSLQLWRFFTPVLMHFGLPHLLFNSLWIWVVGRRIEQLQGWQVYLALLLWSGVLSNIAQFYTSGPMFGGLSGIVFALLAYTWLWDKQARMAYFGFPPALMMFMVVWLLLGFTGLLQTLGFGAIANTAHLAGLVLGLLAVPLIKRLFGRHPRPSR